LDLVGGCLGFEKRLTRRRQLLEGFEEDYQRSVEEVFTFTEEEKRWCGVGWVLEGVDGWVG